MVKVKRISAWILTLALCVLAFSCASPAEDKKPEGKAVKPAADMQASDLGQGKPAEDQKLGRIVFLTTSKGCDCTMNRCKKGEEAVKAATSGHPSVPEVERLDYAVDIEASRALLKKHPAMALPVVYLFDGKGELLEKLEGEFGEDRLSNALKKHRGGG